MSTELRPGDQGGGIGDSINRREDPELLTGRGTFVDDIEKRGMLHMAIHRSQYAHAEIEGIDTSEAEAMDGVEAVFTAEDMAEAWVPGHVPPVYRVQGMIEPDHPILARDRVRHQGKPVAIVVADDRYLAHRAAETINVDYQRLEPVINPIDALDDDAPQLHEEVPDNLCFEYEDGDAEATVEALDEAENVVDFDYTYQRLAPNAIEPRGMVAEHDPTTNKVTVEMPTQNPFLHQTILAEVLGHPQNRIRIKSPRIGGSFAWKSMVHPEECLTAFTALQLQQPVKYICNRSETFQSDEHGRSMEIKGSIGVNDDGDIVGARIQATCGLGATLSSKGVTGPTAVFGPMISGAYKIPALHYKGLGVFTNATPASAYRGVGRAPASFTVERLVSLAAREIDMDPAEIRRKNFVQEDEFPYETPVLTVYDSGTYEKALDKAMEMVDYEELREEQKRLREEGRYLGIGIHRSSSPAGSRRRSTVKGFG
jgi:carbon-monoxide dehydrogenase large subunit